jgi:hypothetical protein
MATFSPLTVVGLIVSSDRQAAPSQQRWLKGDGCHKLFRIGSRPPQNPERPSCDKPSHSLTLRQAFRRITTRQGETSVLALILRSWSQCAETADNTCVHPFLPGAKWFTVWLQSTFRMCIRLACISCKSIDNWRQRILWYNCNHTAR